MKTIAAFLLALLCATPIIAHAEDWKLMALQETSGVVLDMDSIQHQGDYVDFNTVVTQVNTREWESIRYNMVAMTNRMDCAAKQITITSRVFYLSGKQVGSSNSEGKPLAIEPDTAGENIYRVICEKTDPDQKREIP